MADNNENNQTPKKKPIKWQTIIGILLILSAFGLLIYLIVSSVNRTSYYKTFKSTEFSYVEKEDGTYNYSGEIYELLKDHEPNDKYGDVQQIKSTRIEEGGYYFVEAKVSTKFTNTSTGVSTYSPRTYSFKITEADFTVFHNFIKTTKGGDKFDLALVERNDNSWILNLLLTVGMVVIGYFLFRSLFRGMAGGASGRGSGMFDNGFNSTKKSTKSNVRFSDVAGIDEVKAELVEVVDYFTNSKKYKELGAVLPKGVLLVGPPGTGKTLLAKAVAGEANVPFYSISGSDFVEMYVGVGASRVRDMFKTAKENAPCLVFIDEIDAVGRQRGAGLGGGNDEREQTLNQLLVEMDGFEDSSGVIIMAATNRSDVLDPALTRPGRFDRVITVDYPDKEGREAILKVHSRNKKVSKDVDYDSIARNTVGFAGADLANVMNEAAILAVREGRDEIVYQDIDEAIDRRIAGPAKTNKHLVEKERWQVAYHESGHAVVGLKLEYSNKVQKITIVPRGRTGGHVLMTPENDQFLQTKSELLAQITGFLAGRTSEEIFFGDVSTGASNDFEQATQIARSMVTRFGMSNLGPINYDQGDGNVFLGRDYGNYQRNYSDQIALEIDNEVRRIIEECHQKAKEILTTYRDDVELLAKTVFERETINGNEIKELLEKRELPPLPKKPNKDIINFYRDLHKVIDKMKKQAVVNYCLVVSKDDFEEVTKETVKDKIKEKNVTGKTGVIFITKEEISKLEKATKEESNEEFNVSDIYNDVSVYTSSTPIIIFGSPDSVKAMKEQQNKPTDVFAKKADDPNKNELN